MFFDGERGARREYPAGNVFYYFSDHLKTASVVTDSLGNIKSESDFYPWGGELQFVNNDSNHYKFTGKERDSETQLEKEFIELGIIDVPAMSLFLAMPHMHMTPERHLRSPSKITNRT